MTRNHKLEHKRDGRSRVSESSCDHRNARMPRRDAVRAIGGLAGLSAMTAFGRLTMSMSGGAHASWAMGGERTTRPRIKVGQIGVGHAHASKLSVFRHSEDYEVVGIVEPDPELRGRAELQDPYKGLP